MEKVCQQNIVNLFHFSYQMTVNIVKKVKTTQDIDNKIVPIGFNF